MVCGDKVVEIYVSKCRRFVGLQRSDKEAKELVAERRETGGERGEREMGGLVVI